MLSRRSQQEQAGDVRIAWMDTRKQPVVEYVLPQFHKWRRDLVRRVQDFQLRAGL